MRRTIAVLLLLAVLVGPSSGAPEALNLAVGSPEALVRSGPGREFYPTSRLREGERVDVYRRKSNGWCAIRPPEGSFSYVRADHVRPTETDDQLEVIHQGARTRVGSRLDRLHTAEYVTLKLGERLQRLGGPLRLGAGGDVWYPIAPPAGEFRWIHQQDLQPPTRSVQHPSADSRLQSFSLPAAVVPAPIPNLVNDAQDSATRVVGTPVPLPDGEGIRLEKLADQRQQMTTEPIPSAPEVILASHQELDDDGASTGKPTISDDPTGPWTVVQANTTGDLTQTVPGQPDIPVIPTDLTLRLVEMDLALSRMVTQEIDRWDLAELRRQATEAIQVASDQDQYRAAQQLLTRIDEFTALQRKHQNLVTPSPMDRSRSLSLSAAIQERPSFSRSLANLVGMVPNPPAGLAGQRPNASLADVRYAGEGWLVPVVGSQPNVPRFALTDEQGSIRAFVSPRPGLNLRRYQRREVGIIGQETARANEQTPHLLADRVIVLSRHGRY